MHQKISETQIRKETGTSRSRSRSRGRGRGRGRGISSGSSNQQIQSQPYPQSQSQIPLLPISPNPPPPTLLTQHPSHFHFHHDLHHPISSHPSTTQSTQPLLSSPHKRPTIMNLSPSPLSLSSTLSSVRTHQQSNFCPTPSFATQFSIKTIAYKLFFHLSRARLLCVHLRVLVLISLPSLYFFLSNPNRFFILNFVSILAFSVTLLVSLNLAFPRLPSVRLLLSRSLPNKLNSTNLATKASKPVLWTIGSKSKVEKRLNSGSWVQVYSNGDVYEGEFHKGKCSGSGVYYYNMSGRYEGDWVDEKYDGHGVETWAKGSRYRGQYRQGLRHGIGVYRFYSGDVYAGEWSNGQCHGCGIYTCEDGSRYVGEFKWGVKHGLGRYHFR